MDNFCRSSDLFANGTNRRRARKPAEISILFILLAPTSRLSSSDLPRTRINGTRIAFWADMREEVDRIAELVRQAGGKNPEGPETCVDYSPGYYAFFFEDPDWNKLEICCRESPIVAA